MQQHRKQVLVVEDDPDIREMLLDILTTEGYQVVGAENGKEALAILDQIQHPCLILLDLFMPVMDGREFLKTMRSHGDAVASIPVVVITAGAVQTEEVRDAATMATELIRKPINIEDFLKTVSTYCCKA